MVKPAFPIIALLLSTLFAVFLTGCGEENEEEGIILRSTIPPDGGTIANQFPFEMKFDEVPQRVTVNGTPAIIKGTEAA